MQILLSFPQSCYMHANRNRNSKGAIFTPSLQDIMQTGDSMELELHHGERTLAEPHLLEEFAHNMADGIVQSFLNTMRGEKCEVSSSDPDQTLAEELALMIIEMALSEVCVKDQIKGSEKTGNEDSEEEWTDSTKIRPVPPPHPPLYQSGLPLVGSLDYPDAPPSTPLLPELQRSRRSFAQKLKGGLANAFLPSPPPPTPKDKEDSSGVDPHMELMEHLMLSLSTDDLPKDGLEAAAQRVEHFAEALSCDIVSGVLSVKGREEMQNRINLDLLAQKMAETIITYSLGKTKTLQ
ncbi:hypothetical protein OJAV_G00180040 [Oryzias javanicus]|uniref:Uncharacterized protein n=1 Tax=Oryzias javanicus TaxID=123683 RepID=A0A437CDD8_ORYJA|nr:hypothetical protein OJAV_G00180040 [Oryzias javanicus]